MRERKRSKENGKGHSEKQRKREREMNMKKEKEHMVYVTLKSGSTELFIALLCIYTLILSS